MCSTEVKHTSHNQEVMGSNPTVCPVFLFFSFFLRHQCKKLVSQVMKNGQKVAPYLNRLGPSLGSAWAQLVPSLDLCEGGELKIPF